MSTLSYDIAKMVFSLWFAIPLFTQPVCAEKDLLSPNQLLEWEAAVNYCQVNNGRLLSCNSDISLRQNVSNNADKKFWVSKFDNSMWIRIIGCYWYTPVKYLNGTLIPNITVGRCEQHCRQSVDFYFGIKDDTCYCISEIFPMDFTNNCLQSCTGDSNDICGGSLAISVYGRESREILESTCQKCDCVTLQCQDKEPVLEAVDCSTSNAVLCWNNEIFKEDDIVQNLTGNELSFACGKYGLSLGINETLCNDRFILPRWIGVVRKTVENCDSSIIDMGRIQRCWHCHLENEKLGNCSSGNCSEALNVICELPDVADTAATEIADSPTTDLPQHKHELEIDLDSLLIGVALSVVIPVCSVIIVIFVMQMNRPRRQDRSTSVDGSTDGGNVPHDHAYHVVEPCRGVCVCR